MTSTSSPPTLDPVAVSRWQRTAPLESPWLHEEVAGRMLERLQWIRLQPDQWAHWGAVRGGTTAHLKLTRQYRQSKSFVVESSAERMQAATKIVASKWWQTGWSGGRTRVELPAPASMDMLWANMALHEAADPEALLAEWRGLLKVGGFLMFSCLGPDTARELRELYLHRGWPPAGHEFTDMHDWGDMLVQTGFAEPVMDMERITLTFDSPERLLAELAGLGRNFHPARFAALRGRGWRTALLRQIDTQMKRGPDGRLSLTFEIIYGHALKAAPRVKVGSLSAVSMDDMRSLLQQGRSRT